MPGQRFLVVNIFGIGDVLFTTPLLAQIKESCPEAWITYVANPRAAEVLHRNPAVDQIVVYDRDAYHDLYCRSKRKYIVQAWALLRELRQARYDTSIDLSMNGSINFLLFLAGIPRRVGFNYKNRSPFLTQPIPLSGYEGRHVVEYCLDLLPALGLPAGQRPLVLPVADEDRAWSEVIWQRHGLGRNGRPVVAVFPGGGASWGRDAVCKRWPAENYARAIDKMIEKFQVDIILLGNPAEESLCDQVQRAAAAAVVNLCGQAALGQAAALLARCRLALVNDGGPLHMAVAVGCQTVAIFGPVDERVYGPYPRGRHRVVTQDIPCRPCYRNFRRAACDHFRCIQTIGVDAVLAKVREALDDAADRPDPQGSLRCSIN